MKIPRPNLTPKQKKGAGVVLGLVLLAAAWLGISPTSFDPAALVGLFTAEQAVDSGGAE